MGDLLTQALFLVGAFFMADVALVLVSVNSNTEVLIGPPPCLSALGVTEWRHLTTFLL